MMKQALALALAGMCATSSMAAVTIQTVAFGIVPPAGSTVIDFNSASNVNNVALPTGFTAAATGFTNVYTGSHPGTAAAPMNDATKYLAVSMGTYTLKSSVGFSNLSFYWGSIDAGNTLQLLDVYGNVFYTLTGSNALMSSDASGNWFSGADNRTVLINSDQRIFGTRFVNSGVAFELDNLAFGGVPEPATWAMMVAGFGLIGFATRLSRKQNRSTLFA